MLPIQSGVRKLESPNLDLTEGGQIQFYIQIGGGACKASHTRGNGKFFVLYSILYEKSLVLSNQTTYSRS